MIKSSLACIRDMSDEVHVGDKSSPEISCSSRWSEAGIPNKDLIDSHLIELPSRTINY